MYCQRLLASDPSRRHVYAFVTDLATCWLLKVEAAIVDQAPLLLVGNHTLQLTRFPWYDQATKDLLGLKVLIRLSNMDDTELGMSPTLATLGCPVNLRALGAGSTAHVYEAKFPGRSKLETVLKIVKSSPGDADHEKRKRSIVNERDVLRLLNGLVAQLPQDGPAASMKRERIQEALNHIPWCDEHPNLGISPELLVNLYPVAWELDSNTIDVVHIGHLFYSLRCSHVDGGWLHGDLSYHNLMLAPNGWRKRLNMSLTAEGAIKPSKTAVDPRQYSNDGTCKLLSTFIPPLNPTASVLQPYLTRC